MNSFTFTIIKPNAVAAGNTGKILDILIESGFKIRAMKMLYMNRNQAEHFYIQHKGKDFFERLIKFMSSGAIVVAILERDDENAIAELRRVGGATNPANAAQGSIRQLFGESLTRNAIHASDSPENATSEWSQFFTAGDIVISDYCYE